MTLLMTGFPGFLGSALLPRLLARRGDDRAYCLVPRRHLPAAQERLTALKSEHPELVGRVTLLQGDLTAEHLGLTVPDPELAFDGEHYRYGAIDWDEFFTVMRGDGPCNRQRMAHRVRAHEDGAWVREAAAAYAAKQKSEVA